MHVEHTPRGARVIVAVVLACGCNPDVGWPSPSRAQGGDAAEVRVEIDPPAALEALPRVFRARVRATGPIDVTRLVLVRGEVGSSHLRQLEHDDISKALADRIVPSLSWLEGDAGMSAGVVAVLAPIEALEPGEAYAIAGGDPPFAVPLRVSEEAARPLARVWPPAGGAATAGLGVWCGDEALAPIDLAITLDPGGIAGTIRAGAFAGMGPACARFEAEEGAAIDVGSALVGPPALIVGGATIGLDPRPFAIEVEAEAPGAMECRDDEAPFGPGCARVLDDRLIGRAPDVPLLWALRGDGVEVVIATAPGDPFVLAPLPALARVAVEVATYDAAGRGARATEAIVTLAPMPHVVLHEVLANPTGAEPSQEWIELVNDGAVHADLDGYVLTDVGGETPLPAAKLAPGGIALLVNDAFEPDEELDVVPAEGTLVLRVPKLGKSGLNNGGEPLKLLDARGDVVSRFPASPKPKAGKSVARVAPGAPDGLDASFVVGDPTPGWRE